MIRYKRVLPPYAYLRLCGFSTHTPLYRVRAFGGESVGP